MFNQNFKNRLKAPKKERPIKLSFFVLFIGGHILLAFLMNKSSAISTISVYLTITAALVVALSTKKMITIIYMAGYIAASGVLWRMTHAVVLWEIAKYAMSLILFIGIVRKGVKKGGLILLYFILLLPSIYLSVSSEVFPNFFMFRKAVSYNMSGPLALTMAALFFMKFKISVTQLENLFLVMLAPIVGIGFIAGFHTFTAQELYFTTDSLMATSGGYGPNQVSSTLGFGSILAFWYLMMTKRKPFMKLFLYLIGFILATQCALTFSRGGLYAAVLGLVSASFYLIRNRKVAARFLITAIILVAAGVFIAFPKLNEFTGGAIKERFQETSLTGRDTIMRQDMQIWLKNPILGVGPGIAKFYRRNLGKGIAHSPHTEFSRVVAEHGSAGLLALLCLFFAGFSRFVRCKNNFEKGFVICMIGWSMLCMMTAAMRTALPSYVFGLAMANIITLSRAQPSSISSKN